jgi:hypothetical protein
MPSAADLVRRLEERLADAGDVVDHDDALATGGADHVAQQGLAVLDRAGAQIVAVEVEEVEGGNRLSGRRWRSASVKKSMWVTPRSSGTAISPSSTSGGNPAAASLSDGARNSRVRSSPLRLISLTSSPAPGDASRRLSCGRAPFHIGYLLSPR